MAIVSEAEARERNCHLETVGRVTGRPREIEIWFAADGDRLYLLSGGKDRSDWVKNIRHTPAAKVRIGTTTWCGTGRVLDPREPEDARARDIVSAKYGERTRTGDLSDWARESLVVAIDLEGVA